MRGHASGGCGAYQEPSHAVELPPALAAWLARPAQGWPMAADYDALRAELLG